MLAPETVKQNPRLRYGSRLTTQQPEFIPTEIASRLSAPMRQALYWEQACASQKSYGFGLSPYANARLQYHALEGAEWASANMDRAA